jgi:hypothetical protein
MEALAARVTRLTEKLTMLKEEMGKVAVYRKQMLVSPVAVGHGKAHSWILPT